MKQKVLLLLLILSCTALVARAQNDRLAAKRNVIPGNYNFWVYTPDDYYYSHETTPLVIFLHGASLCGHDLNRVLRYGPIDAVKKGLSIPALIIAPQNPGGPWSPLKLNQLLEWMKENYAFDHSRVYVLGMSLGGYGTMDFAGTYPEKIAAAMALCGGATIRDFHGLGELPLWIIHGTGDRAIPVKQSQTVVSTMKAMGLTKRLRYDWPHGASHGALARYFYTRLTYDWLFAHSLQDPERPVDRQIDITPDDLSQAYRMIQRRTDAPELE
ncbi:MAG: phospholipase [Bacteroidaceae bacterium]|nr:phospholipase [Bacteroidaceae bacterium]MBR1789588.1 phospholipase [Bacteroidaceae bacterium]